MNTLKTTRQKSLFVDSCNVVDATLRDAGYLNNWEFSREEIFAIVCGVAKAGVEAIEIGYISDSSRRPPIARCDARLLQDLREVTEEKAVIVAMISLSEKNPDTLFSSRSHLLDLVRIPTTIGEIPIALSVAEQAKHHGIPCSINLVNISTLSGEQLIEAVNKIEKAGLVDIVYLADSRGACTPEETEKIVAIVREAWDGLLGFHAHSNTGFATVNSLIALNAGFQLIDGTIDGLGLGSGNTNLVHALTLVEQYCPEKAYLYEPLGALRNTLSISIPIQHSYLYYLVGAKNLAQLWVDPLIERYGYKCSHYLQAIPRKRYAKIDEVFSAIDELWKL